MAIDFDFNAAKIKLDWAGFRPNARPDFHQTMIFHSGKGFRAPAPGRDFNMGDAWTATGTLPIRVDGRDTLDKWEFGFIQICRFKAIQQRYVGRTRKDGHAVRSLKNLIQGEFHMDSDSTLHANPFMRDPVTGTALKAPQLTCTAGDHPAFKFPLVHDNTTTKGENLLFEARYGSDFWTVLSLKDPDEKFFHLAHFTWSLLTILKVDAWKEGSPPKPLSTSLARIFTAEEPPVIPGAPLDIFDKIDLHQFNKPANKKAEEAIARFPRFPDGVGLVEDADWPKDIPNDFFTP